MRTPSIAASIALALTLAACEATPTAAPADTPPEPTPGFTSGPPYPGPVVVRVEGSRLFAVFNDPDRELLSVHGLDPEDFLPCGTGTSLFGEVDIQTLDTPSEVERLTELFRARDANVAVYGTREIPRSIEGFCTLFAGPRKIAEGPHDFLATVNDAGGVNHERAFRFVGELEGVDGSTIRYTEVQAFVDGRGFVVEDIFLRTIGGGR